jgi:hypothetical protein
VRKGGHTRVLICNHRRYISRLAGLVASGAFDPKDILTQTSLVTEHVHATGTLVRDHPITPDKLVR